MSYSALHVENLKKELSSALKKVEELTVFYDNLGNQAADEIESLHQQLAEAQQELAALKAKSMEPVAWIRFGELGNVLKFHEGYEPVGYKPLYLALPTVEAAVAAALKKAADEAYYVMACPVSGTSDASEVRQEILAIPADDTALNEAIEKAVGDFKRRAKAEVAHQLHGVRNMQTVAEAVRDAIESLPLIEGDTK